MHRQPEPTDRAEVNKLATAVDEALVEAMQTRHRDTTPLPPIGTAPPVAQPGRPPMSQKATDVSALMLSAGATALLVGTGAGVVMLASGYADPVVIAWICAAPAALAVPILALSRLLKAAGQAAPPEVHQHYSGPVQQLNQTVTNENRWLGKSTTNL